MGQTTPPKPAQMATTSIRVEADLLERFRSTVLAEDLDVSKDLRRYMRRRVADAEKAAKAATA